MSLLALLPMHTAFDSVEMEDDGLILNFCGFNGSSRIYLPRAHIDYLHSGRLFYFRTLLAGLALLLVGVISWISADNTDNVTLWKALTGAGAGLILFALILMLQSSLLIATNNGVFISTQSCGGRDRLSEISKFVATGVLTKFATPVDSVLAPSYLVMAASARSAASAQLHPTPIVPPARNSYGMAPPLPPMPQARAQSPFNSPFTPPSAPLRDEPGSSPAYVPSPSRSVQMSSM